MNEKLLKASDYGDRENQAVLQVLVELAQILGSQHQNFVLVGGSVPSLLFENATPEHGWRYLWAKALSGNLNRWLYAGW